MKVEMTARNWLLAIAAIMDEEYPVAYKNIGFLHEFVFDGIDRMNIADSYETGNVTTRGYDEYIEVLNEVNDGLSPFNRLSIVEDLFDRYETVASIYFSK